MLFLAPSLIERATGGGALKAGAFSVPAAACSVLAVRLVDAFTGRFTDWQLSAGLAGLTVLGVLVVAVFNGPIPVVVCAALTVCGFAGAQAVLVGLAWNWSPRTTATPQKSLVNFMIFLGGAIGPAAVAGLSAIMSVPTALRVLAALPLIGLILSLTQRPGAGPRAKLDDTRVSPTCPSEIVDGFPLTLHLIQSTPYRKREPRCGRRTVQGQHHRSGDRGPP